MKNNLEYLKNSKIKAKDIYDYVRTNDEIYLVRDRIYNADKEDLEKYKELGYIESLDPLEAKREINEFIEKIKRIEINIDKQKYIDEESKNILKRILEKSNNVDIVETLLKTKSSENKFIIKILSALQEEIDKLNTIDKERAQQNINEILNDYKNKKEINDTILLKIESLLEKYDIKDVIKDDIPKISKSKLKEDIFNDVFEKIVKFSENNSIDYVEFIKGNVSIKEQLEKIERIVPDKIEELKKEINEVFKSDHILKNKFINIVKENSEITKNQEQILNEVYEEYKQGKITKEELIRTFNVYSDNNIESLLEKQFEIIKDYSKHEKSNKEKIIESKRFELLNEISDKLEKISDINVKDNQSIVKDILQENTVEEASYKVTTNLLDKMFGEGTITEKVIDWILKKTGLHKLGKILSKYFKGLFGKIGTSLLKFLGILFGKGLKGIGKAGLLSSLSLASTGALGSIGGGLASAGSFLVSNPVGWAILGAGAVAGTGYYFYNKKYGEDKKLIKQLEQIGAVDYNIIGNSHIKDWNIIEQLSPENIKKLIHFNDWDDKTKKRLKEIYENKIKNSHKIDVDKNYYENNSDIHKNSIETKTNTFNMRNNKDIKINTEKQENSIKNRIISTINKGIEYITPIGSLKKTLTEFGGKDYKLIKDLEDAGAIDYNMMGYSYIKNWDYVENLSSKEIKQLIHFNDWDNETKRRLNNILQERNKKLENLYNQGVKDFPNLVAASNMKKEDVKNFLSEKTTNSITFKPKIETKENKKREEKNEQMIINQTIINKREEIDKDIDFFSRIL